MTPIMAYTADEALHNVCGILLHKGTETESRNGPVLQYPYPLLIKYVNSRNMVVRNPVRNGNPFFHLMEAAWMLCGRHDIASLNMFNNHLKTMSDNGETYNGAYGYRWRHAASEKNLSPYHDMDGLSDKQRNEMSKNSSNGVWGREEVDQLSTIINHLRDNPQSRRAVLQMWNVKDDLKKIDQQSDTLSKDVCCNTHVYFQKSPLSDKLDMTVMNRSNDIMWGMLGANIVTFSFLHQYMSAMTGIPLGAYYHFTVNAHVYLDIFPREKIEKIVKWYKYDDQARQYPPLFIDNEWAEEFVSVMVHVFTMYDKANSWNIVGEIWNTKSHIVNDLYLPMIRSYLQYKVKKFDYSKSELILIDDRYSDWRTACMEWIERAEVRFKAGNPYNA